MQAVFLCDLWLDKTEIRQSIVLQSNCQDYQDKWSTPRRPHDEQTQIEKVCLGETACYRKQWNIQKHFGTKGGYAEGRETQQQKSMNTVQSMNTKTGQVWECTEKNDNTDWQKHSSKQMGLDMETYTKSRETSIRRDGRILEMLYMYARVQNVCSNI